MGFQPWTGRFVATDRNVPAASLFADCGFVAKGACDWTLEHGPQDPVVPAWFVVNTAHGAAATHRRVG